VLRQVVDLSGRRDALVPNQAVRGCSSQELYGESYTLCSMARKKGYARKMKKIEPAVQTLTFEFDVSPGGTPEDFTLDLSQCASLVNRRFYRQGINWAVSGFKILTSAQTGTLQIRKLPETWIMSNSWEKGFRTWQRMNNEALEESESVRPRFLDFKIYADSIHHAAGFNGNLLPGVYSGGAPFAPAVPGEWESSKYEIPIGTAGAHGQTASREVLAVGANYPGFGASGLDAVSLIEGYAASRGLPNVLDPNALGDADDVDGFNPDNWIAATFNEGTTQTESVIEDMITENNIAPYPFENDGFNVDTMYPNGANQLSALQVHDAELITGTTVGGTTRMKGGMFPCGLVRINAVNSDEVSTMNIVMQVDLVPGNHRGYLCEPMTEM